MVKDGAGEPVLLRPGAVWVEVVDSSWPVLWYPTMRITTKGPR